MKLTEKEKLRREKIKLRSMNKKVKKQYSRSKLIKEADRVFSLYIRGRDSGKPCCTCGARWEENHQAGHFMSRRHQKIRWNPKNCHSQCPRCNLFGAGEQFSHGKYIDEQYGAGTSDFYLSTTRLVTPVTDSEILETIQHYYRLCFEMGLDYKPKKQFLT